MKQTTSRQTTGIVCVLAAATLWGMMGLYVRRFNAAGLGSWDVTTVRVVCGLVLVAVFLALFRRDRFRIRIKDSWIFGGTGICSLLFFSWCYFESIRRTSLSVAGVLLYTAPIFVMLLSAMLFGERITKTKTLALVLAFSGCACVSGILTGQVRVDAAGLLLGLGSGFGYALYSIFSRYAIARRYDFWTILFYTFLLCALGCAPFADWPGIMQALSAQPSLLLWTLAMGFNTAFLAYGLYTIGLERMESSRASIVASWEPVVGTIIGFLFFQELPTWDSVLGILLVLGAIVVLSVGGTKRKQSVNNM